MISFDHPTRFLVLLCIVPLVYLFHFGKRSGTIFPFPFSIWKQEGFTPRLYGPRFLIAIMNVAFWGGLLLLIFAWAGPSRVIKEQVHQDRGADIMIVLDESPSMAAKDFQPENRFEAARAVIRKFVASRTTDAVGLVSFALEAALRVPLTTDYSYFLEQLDSLSIMDLGDGTALGMGIAIGLLHLKDSIAQEKVMILLTDGKQNAGDIQPETASLLAGQLGIRIYVIGIGTPGETYIDFTNPKTGIQYRGTFEGGFDEGVLRDIASRSSGNYFYAGNPEMLSSVFKMLDSLEPSGKRVKLQVRKIPLHTTYSLGGLVLLFMAFIIRTTLLREIL
ncbi:MAG: VWA domain-containing protein [Spirochaetes bacterium]|nr:VWA domain-containing protein [Spirochaetota bacterium]